MARGKLTILRSFDEFASSLEVKVIVRQFASSSHYKSKSLKTFSSAHEARIWAGKNKNRVMVKELRRTKSKGIGSNPNNQSNAKGITKTRAGQGLPGVGRITETETGVTQAGISGS